jgi:hypothetical protein
MTVHEILTLANFIINKEASGDVLTPTSYNTLLKEVNVSLFNDYWRIHEQFRDSPQLQHILADSPLAKFIVSSDIYVNVTNGVGTLPVGTIHVLSAHRISNLFPIEMITPIEALRRRSSVLSPSASVSPFAYVRGSSIQTVPYNNGAVAGNFTPDETDAPGKIHNLPGANITLVYLALPATPVYDYCQSIATSKRIFMPVGSRVYLDDSMTRCLYDANGVLLATGVSKTGTYPIVSSTVELAWREDTHNQFISRILGKAGVSLSEMNIAQYAELMKKEGE